MSRGAKLINIGGDENDSSYRYRMPPLQTKIEGRGNGIKTVLVNVVDVCKCLRTQPDWVTKFFGMEKGALSRFEPRRDVGIVNGAHQASEFQKDLKTYINDFILCPQCKLPELQTKVNTTKALLMQKCMSCNWKGRNTSQHRVKTYMINHPPEKGRTSKAEGGDRAKEDGTTTTTKAKQLKTKKPSSTATPTAGGGAPSAAKDDENDASWQPDPMDKEIAQRTQEQLELLANSKRVRELKLKSKSSEKEVAAAPESPVDTGISSPITEATLNTNTTSDTGMDATLGGPVDVLRVFFNECEHSLDEQLDEIHRLKLAYGLDDEHKYKVLLDAALNCNDEKTLMQSLKEHKLLLQQLTLEPGNAEQFFRAFEVILARRNQGKLQEFVNEILLCLFDEQIVGKEAILNWYHKESERSAIEVAETIEVKNAGKTFIDWLKGAGVAAD